jgi:hypothetical protein
MNPQPLAAIDAKIAQARQRVVEEQQRARGFHTRDDEASRVLIHDLTHWLRKLEAQRENLLRLSLLHSKVAA